MLSTYFNKQSKMKTSTFAITVAFTWTIGYFGVVEALTCYKCNSNEPDDCSEKPDQLPLSYETECDSDGYCTIVRTEYTDIPGAVVALVRDCSKKPLVLNGVRTDKHYTKMYTSCNVDRCNSGNGTRDPDEGDRVRNGPKDAITVQESASNWMNKSSYIFTLGILCLYLLF